MKNPWTRWLAKLPGDPDRTIAAVRQVGKQFHRDQCFVSAGMLTYATLLSLVPLTTVVVSIVAALPGAGDWSIRIQEFAFQNFVPAAQETIQDKLGELTESAKGVTAAMGVFLIITSIILMHNIETTVNRIFSVQQDRSWANRFMVYWSALTLGPVLLGASLALSSYFFSLRFFTDVETVGALVGLLRSFTPIIVSALAFFLIFAVVPNRRVPLRHAIIGALVTAVLFEIAKKAFGFYVATFDSYERLYGALAAIPIFLVWIYLSWSIILFGGSFTAALNSFEFERTRRVWPPEREFELVFRLLAHLWEAHRRGESLTEVQLLAREPEAADDQILRLLENLRAAHLIARDQNGDWLLRRDLSQVSIGDLYASGVYAWPVAREEADVRPDEPSWLSRFDTLLAQADHELRTLRERSVVSLLAEDLGPMRKDFADEPVETLGEASRFTAERKQDA